MAESNKPSSLNYDNVISMGISYTWQHGLDDGKGGNPCPGIGPDPFVKVTKAVDLEIANLDLLNSSNQVADHLAASQNKYSNTDLVGIYANGNYQGQGRLQSYSISEGSQSNLSKTSLSYSITNGGVEEERDFDKKEDPVQRTESITVSRDICSKQYTINHDYSISFGDDFDAVTDFPLYAANDSYETVGGRLALGAKEAGDAFSNIADYNQYLDLSAYQTQEGWNLAKLAAGCSGYSKETQTTEDYINGNFSANQTIQIKYTGVDVVPTNPWEATYTMDFEELRGEKNDAPSKCAKATIRGEILGYQTGCASETNEAMKARHAESGYQEFVVNGQAARFLSGFFNQLVNTIDGVPDNSALNPEMKNLVKKECSSSSVSNLVGESSASQDNAGKIEFSFEMNNCPENKTDGDAAYTQTETETTDFSFQNLCGANRKVYTTTIKGDIQGHCGQKLNANGGYERWENISTAFDNAIASGSNPLNVSYPGQSYSEDWLLRSKTVNKDKYEAKGSYSLKWSDAPNTAKADSCFIITVKTNEIDGEERKAITNTQVGRIVENKGSRTPSTKTVDLDIKSVTKTLDGKKCSTDLDEFLKKAKEEFNDNQVNCLVNSLNWTFSREFQKPPEFKGQMGGINDS